MCVCSEFMATHDNTKYRYIRHNYTQSHTRKHDICKLYTRAHNYVVLHKMEQSNHHYCRGILLFYPFWGLLAYYRYPLVLKCG